jgi:ABC-type transport system involved in multi-copper enzyme maturation permease subunit
MPAEQLKSAATVAPLDSPSINVPPDASPLRAWCYLIFLCWQRQLRSQLTLWFALILLVFSTALVGLQTARQRWNMDHFRYPRGKGETFKLYSEKLDTLNAGLPVPGNGLAGPAAIAGVYRVAMRESGFIVFSRFFVFSVFLTFLLPIWSLSFATDSIGGERESRTLIWVLTRPLSRPAIYLAKVVSVLPWTLALNLGGFAILCLAAGKAGRPALALYWPAVLLGSLAFCSLFHLFGAIFRHAAIMSLVYSFFLEMVLANMPGTWKRISIGFYTRCMMFEQAQNFGFQPTESTYRAVSGTTAAIVLLSATVVLLVAGMVVFSRSEYQDLS